MCGTLIIPLWDVNFGKDSAGYFGLYYAVYYAVHYAVYYAVYYAVHYAVHYAVNNQVQTLWLILSVPYMVRSTGTGTVPYHTTVNNKCQSL